MAAQNIRSTAVQATAWLVLAAMSLLIFSTAAGGQAANPFGVQSRADAAQRMIVLAVEQGIASLPPTSGQSFTYEFDPQTDAYRQSEQLGPTAFRSTQTVGPGHLSVRLGTSYFEASRALGPIDYTASGPLFPNPLGYCTRFGIIASAEVALLNLSATYGVTKDADVSINFPLVLSTTHASEVFVNDPTANDPGPAPVPCGQLDALIQQGIRTVPTRSFSVVQVPGGRVRFRDGTNFGLGRVSVGGKLNFYSTPHLQFAFAPEFFFPSPDQEQFAGSDSAALAPRFIGQLAVHEYLRLHVDIGYDYDFSENELRRLAWNAGASVPFTLSWPLTVDAGVGGSRFNEGITWTPRRTDLDDGSSFQTASRNQLGDTFVDFLGGIKVALSPRVVISGAVDVPLSGYGFRAEAVGTIAAELYL